MLWAFAPAHGELEKGNSLRVGTILGPNDYDWQRYHRAALLETDRAQLREYCRSECGDQGPH